MRCSRKCKKQSYPSIYSIGGKQDTQKSVNTWEHIQSLTTSRKLSLTRSPCCTPVAKSFNPSYLKLFIFISRSFSSRGPILFHHHIFWRTFLVINMCIQYPALSPLAQCLACGRTQSIIQLQHWTEQGGRNLKAQDPVPAITNVWSLQHPTYTPQFHNISQLANFLLTPLVTSLPLPLREKGKNFKRPPELLDKQNAM